MMWVLRVEDETARLLRFPPGAVKTLGRGPSADFVLDASLLSRLHCRVSVEDDQLIVEDLGSTNGTFVNDRRVTCVVLNEGDRLRLGRLRLIVGRDGGG